MKRFFATHFLSCVLLVSLVHGINGQTKGILLNQVTVMDSAIFEPGLFERKKTSKEKGALRKIVAASDSQRRLNANTIIMNQDFEGTFPSTNWSVYSQTGYIDAYWDDQSFRSHYGTWSAWCADAGTEKPGAGNNYPNSMKAWMIYGPFDLSTAIDADLDFSIWNQSESNCDFFRYMVSINGSTFYGYSMSGYTNGWENRNLDLTNISGLGNVCGNSSVYIAFIFESDGSITYEGAYVDDIVLSKTNNQFPRCHPIIDYIQVDGTVANSGDTVAINLNSVNESFRIKVRGINSAGNDGGSVSPAGYNSLTLSFPEFTSASDTNSVSLYYTTSSDLKDTYIEVFGNEVIGGDGYAEYVAIEANDENGWGIGEGNSLNVDVIPGAWGMFQVKYRFALSNAQSWDEVYINRDPISGDADCIGYASYSIYIDVQSTNDPPVLLNAAVSPTSGLSGDLFRYSVIYKDDNNDPPATIGVTIDGNQYRNMQYVSGSFQTGAEYEYSTTLQSGNHRFYMYCADGSGDDFVTSSIDAPLVSDAESISQPGSPQGEETPLVNYQYSYVSSGAVSNLGHMLEYQYDWGDGTQTSWSTNLNVEKVWSRAGSYSATVTARCQNHPHITSISPALTVTVTDIQGTISTPEILDGATTGIKNQRISFTAGNCVHSQSDPIEFEFDWGDETHSNWGEATQSHTYINNGNYNVKVRARSGLNNSEVSSWSSGQIIQITNQHVILSSHIFTPNNDDYNDRVVFSLSDQSLSPEKLSIYNVSGRQIREVDIFSNNDLVWDGLDNTGEEVEPGVYIYVIKLINHNSLSGTVTLIR